MQSDEAAAQDILAKLQSEGKFVVSKVNFEVVHKILDWILANRGQRKEFTLAINSSGWSPGAVLYFHSVLSTFSGDVRVKGVAFGECGSAALALFQCCHERVAVRSCGFFIHHIQTKMETSCHAGFKKIRHEIQSSRDLEEELIELQCRRSGLSRKKWMKLADRGDELSWPILPALALKLGLIDQIVDHYDIF